MTPRFITTDEAVNLGGLFRERVARSPDTVGFRHYDTGAEVWRDLTWSQMADEVARWQDAMLEEGLKPGDRVAVMMRNCCEWVMFDQAALALGLITVPIYADDRGGNVSYILRDSGSRLLVIGGEEEWERIEPVLHEMPEVERIVTSRPLAANVSDVRFMNLADWLPEQGGPLRASKAGSDDLASIVYTSGTTGFPKGVMLSHRNMLSNAEAAARQVDLGESDILLSFLPLSHTLERTVGYYISVMVGMTIAYARSTAQLAEDLLTIRPTVMVSVPRIYERVYARVMAGLEQKGDKAKRLFDLAVDVGWKRFNYRQGRAGWSPALLLWPLLDRLVARKITGRLGGRLRVAVSGGAALVAPVSRAFIGLGVPILQGYGLTESSPIISCNRLHDNVPESVGRVLDGVEVKVAEQEELLARGPNIMLGYWNNQEASGRVVDADGWLHTGDKARIDTRGHIYITGRIKEIIVLSNGEKVSPADMEMAITLDPLIEQAMVVGEQKPFLSAICILNPELWPEFASSIGVDSKQHRVLEQPQVESAVLARIAEQVRMFPGYARIVRVHLSFEPWSVENGLLTPTLKLKRTQVLECLAEPVSKLYEGH
ncbi:MAG: AMP-dependent synthetase/ligase [Candidatus Thiodiazotropha sp.]